MPVMCANDIAPERGQPPVPAMGTQTACYNPPRLDFLRSDTMWVIGWDRTAVMRRAQAGAHAHSPHPLMLRLSRCCLRTAALGLGLQV